MRKFLFFLISFIFVSVSIAQTNYYWRAEATNGNWEQSGNWWDGASTANIPGGGEVLRFNNASQINMTNDLIATNRHQIIFEATTPSRSISGVTENTFYDHNFGASKPKIENYSTFGMLLNFPITLGYNPLEINPVNGPFSITGAVYTGSGKISFNYIDVYGGNGDSLAFGGGISGNGGLTIKQNNKVIYALTPVTYSGATTLDAGELELRTSLANSEVTIKSGAKLTINSTGIVVNNITVESSGTFEVLEGMSVTVTNNLSNAGTTTVYAGGQLTVSGDLSNSGTFDLKSDGSGKPAVSNPTASLIVDGTITGDIDIERYITGHNDVADAGWHYISSPIDNYTVSGSVFEPTGTSDLYSWDEFNYIWQNWEDGFDGGFDLVKEKGYLCAYTNDATKTFTGNPNNSDFSISGLTLTANQGGFDDGWNLIGNPFTSAVEWNNGSWGISNVAAIAQVYPTDGGTWSDVDPNGIIPAMNGFFVQVTSGTGSMTVPASARTHNATPWYKSNDETLKLKVSGGTNTYYDHSRIKFNESATDEYDSQFDSHKLYGMSTAPHIFTRIGEEQFSTNTFTDANTEREVDMDFIPGTSGEYTIEVVENTLTNDASVYLEDKVTGQMIDLSDKTTYIFNAGVGDAQDRFKLHFGATGIDEVQKESLQAYVSGQSLFILGEEGTAQLSVFDIQGKQLFNEQVDLNSQFRQSLNLPQGVYVVSVQSKDLVKTAKVIIK